MPKTKQQKRNEARLRVIELNLSMTRREAMEHQFRGDSYMRLHRDAGKQEADRQTAIHLLSKGNQNV